MNMHKLFQQGDVLAISGTAIPRDAKKLSHRILREGEATGHKHVAVAEDVELYEKDGVIYVHCPSGTEIEHEEHNTITLPAGDYTIGAVREYDHFAEEARSVAD